MKKLIIVAALVALVLFGMPYVTGRVAESVTQQLTNELNSNPLEYGELTFKDYIRGYGSTSALIEWQAPPQFQALMEQPITYLCNGDHGVISFSYECQAQNVPSYTEFVNEYLNGEDPLVVGGEVSVFGAATQKIEVKPFTVNNEAGDQFTTEAGVLEIATDKSLEVFNIFGDFGGFSMVADGGDLQVEPMTVNGELRVNEHRLAIGSVGLNIDGLAFNSEQDGQLRVNNIKMFSDTSEQDEAMTIAYRLEVDEVEQSPTGGEQGAPIDDIDLSFSTAGINMAELAEITERLKQLSQFDTGEELSDQEESNRNAQALAMLPELEDLLTAGLNTTFNLSADYAGAPLTADANLELLKDLSLGDFILLSVQPQAFFSKLNIAFNNSIPAELIESSEAGATAMVNSPFYQRNGGQFETALRISQEGIELNGKALTVEEFLAKLTPAR